MNKVKDYKKVLTDILLKKAKGFTYKEKTEEYAVIDGDVKLVKRKIATKHILPDVAAVKALLELSDGQVAVADMTDEQLQVEKLRLIRLLKICDDTNVAQAPQDDANDE